MNVQIEGGSVEELLNRVAEEYGPEARIIAADKVRRGGVGGFFTKERFEMTVAVPEPGELRAAAPDTVQLPVGDRVPQTHWNGSSDAAPASPSAARVRAQAAAATMTAMAPAATGPSGPLSLLELADAVSASEEVAASRPFDTAASRTFESPARAFEAPSSSFEPMAARPVGPTGDTFMESLPPTVSTEDPGFAAVLTRLTASLAHDPGSTVPDTPARLFDEDEDSLSPSSFGAFIEDDDVHVDPARPASLLSKAYQVEAQKPKRAQAPARSRSAARSKPASTPRTARDKAATTAKPRPAKAPTRAAAPTKPAPAPRAPRVDKTTAALTALGLPAELVPTGRGNNLVEKLAKSLSAALPTAPAMPKSAGDVIVVAGHGPAALALARQVAAALHLDDAAVQLAAANDLGTKIPAARLITDRTIAARRRLSWATKPHPVVVALDAPLAPAAAAATQELLTALSPTYVLAVTPAATKPADLAAWLDRMETRATPLALAVTDTDATADPASVLGLGRPVELLDGHGAGAHAWAALLAARVASAT